MADFYRFSRCSRATRRRVRGSHARSPARRRCAQIEQAVWSRQREPAGRGRAHDAGHLRPLARPHVVHARDARSPRRRPRSCSASSGFTACCRTRCRRAAARSRSASRSARQHATCKRQLVGQGVVLAGHRQSSLGLGAATGVTRLMASLLYEVQPVDPLTYAAVAVGLIGRRCARELHAGAPGVERRSRGIAGARSRTTT